MESTQILNGVPSRCISFGGSNMNNPPKYMVVVVPGNPGVVEYYRDFMAEIHRLLHEEYPGEDIPVIGMSHGGHQIGGIDGKLFPRLEEHPHLYDLKGQTRAKLEFIESIPKETKIILIGHSIGCKMLLDVFKSLRADVQARIIKCYMLFPTVERMRETPNGRRLWPLLPYADRTFIHYLLWPLRILPRMIQRYLILLYFLLQPPAPCCVEASLELFHADVYRRIMALVKAELHTVLDLDVDAFKIYSPKIFLYFGQTDGWCPLQFAHEMRDRIPGLNYEICSRGFEHAFVVHSSPDMARVLTPRILEDIQGSGAILNNSATVGL